MLNFAKLETTLDKLNKMSEFFRLTGSTFFTKKLGMDIDLFVEYSDELVKKLILIGFDSISRSKYGDSNCQAVMRYHADLLNPQIDIQLVKDVLLKERVQLKLEEVGLTHPTKEQWNMGFLFCK